MHRAEFTDVPGTALVEALSYISHASKRISSYSAVCRTWHLTLGEESAWRHLCKSYWYATESRLKDWPSLSPKGLYHALELWVPLEGFYVLAPAFPWGLLVLVRITCGRVVADVMRFLPRASGDFIEINVPLFSVDLLEEEGNLRSCIEALWALPGETRSLLMSSFDARLTRAHATGNQFFGREVIGSFFAQRKGLRLAAEEIAEPGDATPNIGASWEPGELPKDPVTLLDHTQEMIRVMCGVARVPLDLMLVQSPADFVPQDSTQPRMRRGLYVGDYRHGMYGQYRTEVLLLDYVELSARELRQERQRPLRIFNRGPSTEYPAPQELQGLCDLDCGATFMRVVKQCGDVHVPMGATTFVAVCGPEPACSAILHSIGEAPKHVENRQTGQWEEVRRAWGGFGTLARFGFSGPSWSRGWLAQLPPHPETGDDRFGFVWSSAQDAVVLSWVTAQDTSPFLQRQWLPADLR